MEQEEEEQDEKDDSKEQEEEEEGDDNWEHEADSVKAIFETELTALKGRQRWCRASYDHMQGLHTQ